MSRNGAGTFTTINTFTPNTTISSSDVNENFDDAGDELSNSVAADGQTTMTGPLKAANGTVSAPSITFGSDLNTGAYRIGADNIGVAVNGAKVLDIDAAGLDVIGAITATSVSNASGAITPSVLPPQGRLTLTSATTDLTADVLAATTIYYTPAVGNFLPIFNGTSYENIAFAEMSMAMSGANFAANAIYDMFAAYDSSTLRIGIGPVWNTLTAGSGARGTGAGTTELERVNGLYLNKNTMTIRYASGSTFSAAAQRATYLGTIFMDGTNSQISCTVAFGQTRKWGVWNAYNRKPILLKAGDSTSSWTVGGAGSVQAQNGSSSNALRTLCGLPEEAVSLRIEQYGGLASNQASGATTGFLHVGLGVNSTSAFSGKIGKISQTNANMSASLSIGTYGDLTARHTLTPHIGVNVITACEQLQNNLAQTLYGGEDDGLMTASWMG